MSQNGTVHDGALTLQLNFAIWNLTLTLFTFPAVDIQNVCRGRSLNTAQLCFVMQGHMANSVYSRRSQSPKPSNCAIKHIIKTVDESIQEVMRSKYFSLFVLLCSLHSKLASYFWGFSKSSFKPFGFSFAPSSHSTRPCSCDCEGQLKGTPQSPAGTFTPVSNTSDRANTCVEDERERGFWLVSQVAICQNVFVD